MYKPEHLFGEKADWEEKHLLWLKTSDDFKANLLSPWEELPILELVESMRLPILYKYILDSFKSPVAALRFFAVYNKNDRDEYISFRKSILHLAAYLQTEFRIGKNAKDEPFWRGVSGGFPVEVCIMEMVPKVDAHES